ncbi:MAG: rane protein [Firmicutes bacterium]|nr:rane protein [Bacillota bacterium]
MAERPAADAFIGALQAESERWVQQGLLTDVQRQAILGLYPPPGVRGRDRTVLIFSILGALLLGAGVILFFTANWPKIPAGIKVSMILAAVIGTYGAGYHLQFTRGDYPRLGHSLIFLGSLFYGAGIWLVAQIFHLDSHYPTGFRFWVVGILPVAALTASRPVLGLATLLLGIWTIVEQGSFASFDLLLLFILTLHLARRLETALVEAGVLAGLYLWFGINTANVLNAGTAAYPPYAGAAVVFGLMALYGVAVVLLGLARAGDERAYLGVGSFAVLIGTYFLTFEWGGSPLPARVQFLPLIGHSPYVLAGFVLILAAAAAGAWRYWRRAEPGRLVVLAVVLVPALAALSQGPLPLIPRLVVFNLVLFISTVGLALLGIQRRSSLLVNLGLTAFVIHTITRYFDLFFSAMDRSVFFILGGIVLLVGGWLLERNRRRWTQDWGGGSHAA